MGKAANQLHQLITAYRLDSRSSEFAQLKMAIERGMISEAIAKAYMAGVQQAVDQLDVFPVNLMRVPSREELYAAGKPDVELGHLMEGEDGVRFGLRLLDRPRHVLIAGATGSGKSTALRNIIINVDRIGRREGGREG